MGVEKIYFEIAKKMLKTFVNYLFLAAFSPHSYFVCIFIRINLIYYCSELIFNGMKEF